MNRPLTSAVFFVLFSTASLANPPKQPTLTVKTEGQSVNLSWTKVADATGYIVCYTPSPFLGPDYIKCDDLGTKLSLKAALYLGDSYFVAMKSYNANNEESTYSNIEQVTISQFYLLYVGLSRYQHNNTELDIGTFQLAGDVDQRIKLSSVRLTTPDSTMLSYFTIKKSNQIELFLKGKLKHMQPYLLDGVYRLEGNVALDKNSNKQQVGKALFRVKKGSYPAFPKITYPTSDAKGVSLNPSISFNTEKPSTLSITKQSNQKEVFFSNNIQYALHSKGVKTLKIDMVTLEPKTKYLLEINQTDMSIAKGSTSAIFFTTK